MTRPPGRPDQSFSCRFLKVATQPGQIRWLLAMAQADGQGIVTFSDQSRPRLRWVIQE